VLFDVIVFGHFQNTSIPENNLKIALNAVRSDGFIPRIVVTDLAVMEDIPYYHYEQTEHTPPVLFQCALLLSRLKGNVNWITTPMYDAIKASLIHWEKHWDRDGNGLCEWASAPHGASDTAFERAGVWQSYYCEGVDLNSLRYMDYLAGEKLARALGHNEDAAMYASKAYRVAELVRSELWNAEDGFFYDRDIRTGKAIRLKHAHCFYAIMSGIATQEQATRMIEEHLLNPNEFWVKYPLPSYAINEPMYKQHYIPPEDASTVFHLNAGHPNFCGSMWPHQTYPTMHGLKRYGYENEAELIASKLAELVDRHPCLYEWYNAETGEGQGTYPFYASVQAVMIFAQAELEAGFNPFIIEDVDTPLHCLNDLLKIEPIGEDIFFSNFNKQDDY